MEQVLGLTVGIALSFLGLSGYFLTLRALFPRRIAKTRTVADLMPGRSLAVGLVNCLFFSLIALVLLSIANNVGEVLKVILILPALICLGLLSIGLSFGLGGMAELVGERLAPAQTALRRTLLGTCALSLGSFLPYVGWFLLFPYAGLVGLGAFIVGFFWKEQASVPSSQTGP